MPGPIEPAHVPWILEIHALKARYFRCVDGKDWAGLAALFTPDATLHFEEAQPEPLGLAASIDFIATGIGDGVSIHHGHMPEIEIVSPREAHGIWAMEDRIHWSADRPSRLGISYLHGLGHYHEEYARAADRWLIRRLKVVRQWVRAIPAAGA